MSSRSYAWGEWRRVSLDMARLDQRESDVIAAVARDDPTSEPLLPDELRRFVIGRVAEERDHWERGDASGIGELFRSEFGGPPGSHRIRAVHGPQVRIVWATRESGQERWRVVVMVCLELSAAARSWRLIWSEQAYKTFSVEKAFWTLVHEGEGWRVDRVEPLDEGRHYLDDPLPGCSDQELHEQATISTAVDGPALHVAVAELTDVDASAEVQLLDLSVVDGRFAPDVIAACVCEIARAWEAASTGSDPKSLEPWATPRAIDQLLRPTPNGLRRVRNLQTRHVRITTLTADAEPATIDVSAGLQGKRWLATHRGGRISGSRTRRRDFTEHWTLRLDPSAATPWRLIAVEDAARP